MLTVNKIIIKTVVLAALLTAVGNAHARLKYYRYNNHIPMVEMSLNMMVAMGLLKEVPATIVNDGNRYNRYARARNAALSQRGYNVSPASYGVSYNSPFENYSSVQNYPGSYGSTYSSPYSRFSTNPYGTLNAPWSSSYSNPWTGSTQGYYGPAANYPWSSSPWDYTQMPGSWGASPWGANPWGGNPWGNMMQSPMQPSTPSPWGGTQYNPWSGSMLNPLGSPMSGLGGWPSMQPSAYPMNNPVRNIQFPLASAPVGGVIGRPVAARPVAMRGMPPPGGAAWVSPWRRPGAVMPPPPVHRPGMHPARPNPYRPVMYPNSRYPVPPAAVFQGRPYPGAQPVWGGQYAPPRYQNGVVPNDSYPVNPYQVTPYTSEQDKLLISMNRSHPALLGSGYGGDCVTRSCGHKSYLDGMWVSTNGEKLGLRDNQFMWTDGKGQHLSGSIYITPTMMRANVDATRRTIIYRYRYYGNEMVTMSNDGTMRSFKRIPL